MARNKIARATMDGCRAALLLMDVINDMDFEGWESPLREALPVA